MTSTPTEIQAAGPAETATAAYWVQADAYVGVQDPEPEVEIGP